MVCNRPPGCRGTIVKANIESQNIEPQNIEGESPGGMGWPAEDLWQRMSRIENQIAE